MLLYWLVVWSSLTSFALWHHFPVHFPQLHMWVYVMHTNPTNGRNYVPCQRAFRSRIWNKQVNTCSIHKVRGWWDNWWGMLARPRWKNSAHPSFQGSIARLLSPIVFMLISMHVWAGGLDRMPDRRLSHNAHGIEEGWEVSRGTHFSSAEKKKLLGGSLTKL